ncbi:hypothetical protein MMC19_007494 [Ptychographa xylographoides]|nr:hypothetical protein [Ptychographa xylographoides]
MAYDLQARFRRLRTATSDITASTAPSYPTPNRDNGCDAFTEQSDDWEYLLEDSAQYEFSASGKAREITRETPAYLIDKEEVATPPINVPAPPTDIFEHRGQEAESQLESRYHEPSFLEDYINNRRPSISFDPKVTLDNGYRTALDQPLPKLEIKTRPRGRSLLHELAKRPIRSPLERAHSEADRSDYDSATGELLRTFSGRQRPLGRQKKYIPHQSRYPLLQTTVDDLALNSPPPEFGQSASLTTEATASPVFEEARTPPPNGEMDYLISPMIAYSPWHHPTSLEESSAWPNPRQLAAGSRAKSYTLERVNSLRLKRRQSSRRSTSSSISPATAFLSRWNREEAVLEPDDEGQEVGDYVLGKEIGFGGFSIVREAFTFSGKERVRRAVKIVRKQLPGKEDLDNDRLQAEFEHEISVWRCLSQKHILPLLAVYNTDFATFAFTQLHNAGTLFDLMRKNRQGLRPDLARRYAYQLASAIRYLHEDVRVVHRDLKLENCLIDLSAPDAALHGGNVLLCDFGLADFFASDVHANSPSDPPTHPIGPSDTSTSIAGSLQYASPELILSPAGLLSTAVDMWAYGVVCYALVVGDLPFQHMFQPRVQMMILAGEWDRSALESGKGWAEGVDDMVRACLCMQPEKRWTVSRCLGGRWLGPFEGGEEGRNFAWAG